MQYYLKCFRKVVAFHLTMPIVLSETLCIIAFQVNIPFVLINVTQLAFPAKFTWEVIYTYLSSFSISIDHSFNIFLIRIRLFCRASRFLKIFGFEPQMMVK